MSSERSGEQREGGGVLVSQAIGVAPEVGAACEVVAAAVCLGGTTPGHEGQAGATCESFPEAAGLGAHGRGLSRGRAGSGK